MAPCSDNQLTMLGERPDQDRTSDEVQQEAAAAEVHLRESAIGLNTNPDFQRPAVWGRAQKQLIIDPIRLRHPGTLLAQGLCRTG
jgi:hypothetical protein